MSRLPRDPRQFKPCDPPRVVRDETLGGLPVLLLGWWLDAFGKPVEVEVATMVSRRRTTEISGFPQPPGQPLPHAPGAYVLEPVNA